jgi:hypothetical protein
VVIIDGEPVTIVQLNSSGKLPPVGDFNRLRSGAIICWRRNTIETTLNLSLKMKSRIWRVLKWILIIEVAYVVLLNSILQLPLTQTLINQIKGSTDASIRANLDYRSRGGPTSVSNEFLFSA